MREGEAERLRADCRAGDLICPVPGCADPRYTTVGGSKRDHFRHLNLANGVHAPETYHHFLAKQVVGAWARRTYPEAAVFVDERQVRGADGKVQVPDVLVLFPDGRRFAFEVQYAPRTIEEWRRRHVSYRAEGIVDVWLWGHGLRYLRPSKDHAERIDLGPVPFAAQRADEEYEERYRATVQRRFAGALDVIEVALQWDRVVYRSPAQWHAKLFDLFIEGQIGMVFAFADVMDRLMSNLPGRLDEMPIAAYNYLLFLHERGFVECLLDDRRLITDVRVLADAANPLGSAAAIPAASSLRNPMAAEPLGLP